MFSTILQIMPLAASLALAESNHLLESRQASAYGQASSYYQGCFSSAGGKIVNQGYDNYQASGSCGPLCSGLGYPAFAVSGSICYCADLLPSLSSQVDDAECNTHCNGIGTEDCGGPNLFSVYTTSVAGSVLPARVSSNNNDGGHEHTSSSVSTSVSTKTVPATTRHTQTHTSSSTRHRQTNKHRPHHHNTAHSKPTDSSSHTTKSSSRPVSSTNTAAHESSTPSSNSSDSSDSSSSTGKTVGIVVGVVGGIVAFAAAIAAMIFYLRRRRRMKNAENGHRRADSLNAFVASGGHMPGSLAGRMQTPSIAINDARLDPWVMKETRRESGGSFLADSQDYSRRILKVTNPDSS